jgi:hypothetical protein
MILWYTPPLLSQPPHFSEHPTIIEITHLSAPYIFVNHRTYLHNNAI